MRHSNLPRQQGAALMVALILLVVMTLLGLASIRIVLQEERMAGNAYDRSLAFQAAEAALRVGEATALAQSKTTAPNKDFPAYGLYADPDATCGGSCADGLCTQPDKDCVPRWEDLAFAGWKKATGLSLTTTVSGTPEYFVEYMGGAFPCDPGQPSINLFCSRYRITARSIADGRAAVTLQSIFATE